MKTNTERMREVSCDFHHLLVRDGSRMACLYETHPDVGYTILPRLHFAAEASELSVRAELLPVRA